MFFLDCISEIYNYNFYFNNNNEHLIFMNIKEKDQKIILNIYYNTTDIINPIIKFIMKMISNGDNKNLVNILLLNQITQINNFILFSFS
jgi:hypothetical protein